MPVTAKLSRRFYDVFGEDVVNELVEWFNQVDTTYRSDLLRLNDLNADRYDAKLKQRFAEFELRLDRRFAVLEAKADQRFIDFEAKADQRFVDFEVKANQRFVDFAMKVDQRFVSLDARLEQRFETIDVRFAGIDVQFAKVDRRFNELETKLTVEAEKKHTGLLKWMFLFWIGTVGPVLAFLQMLR